MAKIVFTKDFATKKKDDIWENCPAMLASRLINIEKVAKYYEKKQVKKQ